MTLYRRQLNRTGLSLVEVIIALAIFATVMALAYAAIVNGLLTQGDQEANVSSQAKLRRVIEVVSQDIRSAVFGSIIDAPYLSGTDSVSFLLLTGGAGYALEEFAEGSSQVEVLFPSDASFTSNQIVIVNSGGQAVLADVTHLVTQPGKRRLTLSCGVPFEYTNNTLLFEVTSLGIDFDETDGLLNIRTGFDGEEMPLAFEISNFQIDYVYTALGEAPLVEPEPQRPAGTPERRILVGGTEYVLSRLQFVVSTEARSGRGQRTHSYAAQVDLLDSQDFTVRELTTCP